MIDIEKILYDKVKSVMSNWNEDGIYAISFFVYSNETYEFRNFTNVSTWAISYNTEADCEGAGPLDEERWNYAFWRQDETSIIDIDEPMVLSYNTPKFIYNYVLFYHIFRVLSIGFAFFLDRYIFHNLFRKNRKKVLFSRPLSPIPMKKQLTFRQKYDIML